MNNTNLTYNANNLSFFCRLVYSIKPLSDKQVCLSIFLSKLDEITDLQYLETYFLTDDDKLEIILLSNKDLTQIVKKYNEFLLELDEKVTFGRNFNFDEDRFKYYKSFCQRKLNVPKNLKLSTDFLAIRQTLINKSNLEILDILIDDPQNLMYLQYYNEFEYILKLNEKSLLTTENRKFAIIYLKYYKYLRFLVQNIKISFIKNLENFLSANPKIQEYLFWTGKIDLDYDEFLLKALNILFISCVKKEKYLSTCVELEYLLVWLTININIEQRVFPLGFIANIFWFLLILLQQLNLLSIKSIKDPKVKIDPLLIDSLELLNEINITTSIDLEIYLDFSIPIASEYKISKEEIRLALTYTEKE